LVGLCTRLPALTLWLIEAFGWRSTWALFGVLLSSSLVVLTWRFVRDRPEDIGLSVDGQTPSTREEPGLVLRDAVRTPSYWILVAAGVLPTMIGTAILFDILPLLRGRGVSEQAAAGAAGAWSCPMAEMALAGGRMDDRCAPQL